MYQIVLCKESIVQCPCEGDSFHGLGIEPFNRFEYTQGGYLYSVVYLLPMDETDHWKGSIYLLQTMTIPTFNKLLTNKYQ